VFGSDPRSVRRRSYARRRDLRVWRSVRSRELVTRRFFLWGGIFIVGTVAEDRWQPRANNTLSKRARSTTPTSLRFRINELRAAWNSVAQNPPSNSTVAGCDLYSALYSLCTYGPRRKGAFRRTSPPVRSFELPFARDHTDSPDQTHRDKAFKDVLYKAPDLVVLQPL